MYSSSVAGRAAQQAQSDAAALSVVSHDHSGFDTRYTSTPQASSSSSTVPSSVGNRYRTFSANSTGSANSGTRGNLREFVSTHLSTAVADEVEEEVEDELIDTINADLLSSRDRNRARTESNSSSVGRTDNSHLYMNSTLHTHDNNTRGLSAHSNHINRESTTSPGDWDMDYRTPHRSASNALQGSASSGSARSMSVGSARGVRGSVRSATHGTNTPSSTPSSSVYSEGSENDSQSTGPDDLESVFRNDFLNRFFPFLSRKGSTFGTEEYTGKKNR